MNKDVQHRERSISPTCTGLQKNQSKSHGHSSIVPRLSKSSILQNNQQEPEKETANEESTSFSNPFTNIHPFTTTQPFTMSNLSESAICTTDDEDNYSFSSSTKIPPFSTNITNSNLSSNYDNESDDERNSDSTDDNEVFQPHPLTDTPVFSAIETNDEDLENDENISDSNSFDLNNGTKDPFYCVNDDSDNTQRNLFKQKYQKLVPNSMERITSQETAVITEHTNSNNNSGSNLFKSNSISNPAVFDIPGQTISKNSPEGESHFAICDKLVVVTIGLPARGKSYLSNKLVRYLNWLQINAKIFNVGATRRSKSKNLGQAMGPGTQPLPDTMTTQDASFFSPDNKASINLREEWARETLDSLLDYLLTGDGCVGVFDATNTTVKRRKMVFDTIKKRSNNKLGVLYFESICNDESIIEQNILLKLKGPDYKYMDPNLAKKDFINRLANYEKVYETIQLSEEMNFNFQYIQMIDVGRKVISCNINGYIASQIVYYFLNFNLKDRLIFITRHGESYDNLKGKIGGDSKLTERGRKYSIALEKFVDEKKKEFDLRKPNNANKDININSKITVISSALKRSIQTAESFNDPTKYDTKQLRLLNELGSGKFDGLTYQEIASLYPEEFENRIKNKLTYRYPGIGGESYLDVISRLKPVINEVERSKSHLVLISHRVVSRILLAYFLNLQKDSISDLDIPLHSVYMFEPKPFGVLWHLWEFDEASNRFKELDLNNLTQNNSKTVKQVGISFRERKYSVVPTAPYGVENLSRKGSFKNSFRSNDLNSSKTSMNEFDRPTINSTKGRLPFRSNTTASSVRNELDKGRNKR